MIVEGIIDLDNPNSQNCSIIKIILYMPIQHMNVLFVA